MTTTTSTGRLSDYLRVRRAALTPDDAGIRTIGPRRVPGLRREELAHLAGVSVTYYTRLEQGQAQNASPMVIDALASALRLDDDERSHLHVLAAAPPPPHTRREAPPQTVTPAARRLLAALASTPAVLMGPRREVLAWNPLGHALLAGHVDPSSPDRTAQRPNLVRMLFLDAHTRDLYRDWPAEARLAVASLRFSAAELPDDRGLLKLIGELSVKSADFASLWARHPVARCASGVKRFAHPGVGSLDLDYQVLHLPDATGQRLLVYAAEPASAAASSLMLLASGICTTQPGA